MQVPGEIPNEPAFPISINRGIRHIKLYTGPMFSGKTKSMLNDLEVKKHAKSCEIILLKYRKDTRSEDGIVISASGASMLADAGIETGQEAWQIVEKKISNKANWISTIVVGIDEGQFIKGLYIFLEHILSYPKKVSILVYIAALDGDFQRKMFLSIIEAFPLIHKVKKCSSVCQGECHDTPAQLTKRIVESEELELIGSKQYIAACFNCHNSKYNSNIGIKRQTVECTFVYPVPFEAQGEGSIEPDFQLTV